METNRIGLQCQQRRKEKEKERDGRNKDGKINGEQGYFVRNLNHESCGMHERTAQKVMPGKI